MKCRSCSAEIADKAIVCYRCGTPTEAPAPIRAAAGKPGRGRLIALLVLLAVLVGLLLFTYFRRSSFV